MAYFDKKLTAYMVQLMFPASRDPYV